MRTVGRGLQLAALVMLLVGLLYGIEAGPHAMSFELGFLLTGVCVFVLGLQLQNRASR